MKLLSNIFNVDSCCTQKPNKNKIKFLQCKIELENFSKYLNYKVYEMRKLNQQKSQYCRYRISRKFTFSVFIFNFLHFSTSQHHNGKMRCMRNLKLSHANHYCRKRNSNDSSLVNKSEAKTPHIHVFSLI